ncbi:hypothetical protein N9235_02055 [Gammaproteobacteria bacterium]|nr:hypothetical protein [Gammaproteobacteria bacterium]
MKLNQLISLVRKLTKLTVAATLLLKAVLKLVDMAINYLQTNKHFREQSLLDPQI